MEDIDEDEIDYMHPLGKSPQAKAPESTEGESARPDSQDYKLALQEADGHSMTKKDSFLED